MYGDAVVQIVDEIALHAVEDLDLSLLAGVPGLGKCLHCAMIRDGDGRVSPRCRLRHHLAHIGDGVHGAHLGMQVQLHPLLRRGILPALMLDAHDAHRLELYVLAVEAQRQLALHPQPHAVADSAAQYPGLLLVHILPHGDGTVLIGHVEVHAPLTWPPCLIALHAEHAALHHSGAHLQVQLPHRHHAALDLLAVEQVAAALSGSSRRAEPQLYPTQVVLLGQHVLQRCHRRLRHCFAADGLHLDGTGLPIQRAAGDVGVVQQQPQLPRCLKALK